MGNNVDVRRTAGLAVLCAGLLIALAYVQARFPHPLIPVAIVGIVVLLGWCVWWLVCWARWQWENNGLVSGEPVEWDTQDIS